MVETSANNLNKALSLLTEQIAKLSSSNFSQGDLGDSLANDRGSSPFYQSLILNKQQSHDLVNLCRFSLNDNFTLLYRGSSDGFRAADFHRKCDGHSNTLTIISPKDSFNIFGGYTSAAWNSTKEWKSDPSAFIFSLFNKRQRAVKINIEPPINQYAILNNPLYGPVFGVGY